MKKTKRLDVYIDESGDFSSYSLNNPIYSVAFVFSDSSNDNSYAINSFNNRLTKLFKGDHFVHVGNLVRCEKPYKEMKREERWGLFYTLYLLSYHSKYNVAVPFIVKPKNSEEIVTNLSKCIISFLNEIDKYIRKYDEIYLHYDFGQGALTGIITASFLARFSQSKVIKTLQAEHPFMQIADLFAYFELLKYKMSKGYLSLSENRFFGGMKNLQENYLNSLEVKYLLKNKKY